MAVLERWYLTNTLAGHNKFYEVIVENTTQSTYEVKARYGKIGTSGKWLTKWHGSNMSYARSHAEQLANEKKGRGYIQRSDVPVTTPAKKLAPGTKDAQPSIALDRFANLE